MFPPWSFVNFVDNDAIERRSPYLRSNVVSFSSLIAAFEYKVRVINMNEQNVQIKAELVSYFFCTLHKFINKFIFEELLPILTLCSCCFKNIFYLISIIFQISCCWIFIVHLESLLGRLTVSSNKRINLGTFLTFDVILLSLNIT